MVNIRVQNAAGIQMKKKLHLAGYRQERLLQTEYSNAVSAKWFGNETIRVQSGFHLLLNMRP